MKRITYIVLMCFSLLAISFEAKHNMKIINMQNQQAEYHIDTFKLYWVEECTIDAGSQCTTPSGSFRFDYTPFL